MNYICAIIKDEHEHIREWVLHHRLLGFDRIILYDNNSAMPYDDVLLDVITGGFVEIRPWFTDSQRRQMAAYEHFAQSNTWFDNDWVAFIDPDEYIYLDDDKRIGNFLKRYSDYAAITIFWKVYGANGRIKKLEGLSMAEAYKKEGDWDNPNFMFKTIVKLNKIEYVYDAHRVIPKENNFVVNTDGQPILGRNTNTIHKHAHIKHYMTRSWEDFMWKMKRRNITRQRNIDTFFIVNPDMKYLRNELVKNLCHGKFRIKDKL